ncbi:MAG: BCCT family transporter [Pseudomonadota bacterium]|nr:BCCT family transporter [Pseudomonadota bacterium]
MSNLSDRGFVVDRAVFIPSIVFLLSTVSVVLLFPDASGAAFGALQAAIVENASWFYGIVMAVLLVASVVLAFSHVGTIRLGPDNSAPDYSLFSWLSMLFAAGVGIGLMFYGVAEPVVHYLRPPVGESAMMGGENQAVNLTMLHWGFNAWSVYALMALVLAYFSFRRGLPLTLRSAFYPILGDRIYGPLGAAIDVFAIVCTTFGISTSLGLGVEQLSTGLNYLFGVPESGGIKLAITVAIMAMAAVSVALGLNSGIKRLSEVNSFLAIALLCFVLLIGPTALILGGTLENFGYYVANLVTTSTNLFTYEDTEWLGGWTIFYWGWWISWAPFVGIFIARISRGRTIREFLVGVMVAPTLFVVLWMNVFGGSAIELIHSGELAFGEAVANDQPLGLFLFLDYLPGTFFLSLLSLVMIVIFFVTSADSGALVLNMMASGGIDETPVLQRVLWTGIIAAISATLLITGGLGALQTATIASALPFSLILLGALWGLQRSLLSDMQSSFGKVSANFDTDADINWQSRLGSLLTTPTDNAVAVFQRETVLPALSAFASELNRNGVGATVTNHIGADGSIVLTTGAADDSVFVYAVKLAPRGLDTKHETNGDEVVLPVEGSTSVTEVHLASGSAGYCLWGLTETQVIADVLAQFEQHRRT